MDTILLKLSEIEDAAGRIMDRADEQKKVLSEEMHARMDAYDKELEESNSRELEEEKKSLQQERESKLQSIRSSMEQQISDMEQSYAKKHSQLSDDILKRILEA